MDVTTEARSGTWRELFGTGLGAAVVLAGGTVLYAINVYVTASLLPTAVHDIGGEKFFAWNATAFLIASVISSMLVAKTLARRGPVGSFLIAFGLFALGTLVCALSPTMAVLLVGRTVQGLGGGLIVGLAYAVIQATFPAHLWTRAAALVSAMWGVGTFVGPALGGFVAQLGPWRMAFFVLAALTLGVAALVPRALPRGGRTEVVPAVPKVSLALLTAAVGAVSLAGVVPRGLWTGVAIVAALVIAALFVGYERRSGVGVLPAVTFGKGSPLKWIYLTILFLVIGINVETFIPLLSQRLAGLAPLAAGFVGAAMSLGWTVAQLTTADAARPSTIGVLRVAGPGVVALGLLATAVSQRQGASGPIVVIWILTLLVAGAGIGMAFPHLTSAVMGATPDQVEAEKASAAIGTIQLIANAFGSAFAGVLVNLGEPEMVRSARYLLIGMAVLAALGVLTALGARRSRVATVETPAAVAVSS